MKTLCFLTFFAAKESRGAIFTGYKLLSLGFEFKTVRAIFERRDCLFKIHLRVFQAEFMDFALLLSVFLEFIEKYEING